MAEKAGNGNGDGDGDGYISTQLFGGAMEADIPVGFEDVSNLRPVPSHQEIYLSATGFTSVSIDITERVTCPASDREALLFHFEDIVTPGDESRVWNVEEGLEGGGFGISTPILSLKGITRTRTASTHHHPPPSSSSSTTTPPPPPQKTTTTTTILLILIRLIPQTTDLILTINIPLHPAAIAAAAAADSGSGYKDKDKDKDKDDDDNGGGMMMGFELVGGGEEAKLVEEGEGIAKRVLGSLRVRDWGLFGGGEGEGG